MTLVFQLFFKYAYQNLTIYAKQNVCLILAGRCTLISAKSIEHYIIMYYLQLILLFFFRNLHNVAV